MGGAGPLTTEKITATHVSARTTEIERNVRADSSMRVAMRERVSLRADRERWRAALPAGDRLSNRKRGPWGFMRSPLFHLGYMSEL